MVFRTPRPYVNYAPYARRICRPAGRAQGVSIRRRTAPPVTIHASPVAYIAAAMASGGEARGGAMRYGSERLGMLVRERMRREPRTRALFVFVGKRGHSMKALTGVEQRPGAPGVGRKAWMFYGSDTHAEAAAAIFSVIATCRLHRLDPYVYLDQILRALPYWPRDRYLELSPKHWLATRARLLPEELAAPLSAFEVPPSEPASPAATAAK